MFFFFFSSLCVTSGLTSGLAGSAIHRTKAERVSIPGGAIGAVPRPVGPLVAEDGVLLAIELRLRHHQAGVVLCAPVFNV